MLRTAPNLCNIRNRVPANISRHQTFDIVVGFVRKDKQNSPLQLQPCESITECSRVPQLSEYHYCGIITKLISRGGSYLVSRCVRTWVKLAPEYPFKVFCRWQTLLWQRVSRTGRRTEASPRISAVFFSSYKLPQTVTTLILFRHVTSLCGTFLCIKLSEGPL